MTATVTHANTMPSLENVTGGQRSPRKGNADRVTDQGSKMDTADEIMDEPLKNSSLYVYYKQCEIAECTGNKNESLLMTSSRFVDRYRQLRVKHHDYKLLNVQGGSKTDLNTNCILTSIIFNASICITFLHIM